MKMIKLGKNDAFKTSASFRSSLIDNAEDLDVVILMYNLLEHSQNYSMTSGSLWNHYIDEIDDVDDNILDGKSFKYKTKIIGKTPERPERPPQLPQNPELNHHNRTS